MDLLPPLTAFSVFLGIAAVGFVFLMIALVFGEVFDFFDHDPDIDMGGPGIFSSRVIAVFITAFGGFGAIGINYGLSPGVSALLGTASGIVFGAAILAFARFLFGQQVSSEMKSGDLVGQSARVVIGIPANGVGQVRCRVGEELVDKIAQSGDGVAIAENTSVLVASVVGETVIVKKV